MASAVIAEALLLSDTELHDLEEKSTGFSKEWKKSDTLSKSKLWTFLTLNNFIRIFLDIIFNIIQNMSWKISCLCS